MHPSQFQNPSTKFPAQPLRPPFSAWQLELYLHMTINWCIFKNSIQGKRKEKKNNSLHFLPSQSKVLCWKETQLLPMHTGTLGSSIRKLGPAHCDTNSERTASMWQDILEAKSLLPQTAKAGLKNKQHVNIDGVNWRIRISEERHGRMTGRIKYAKHIVKHAVKHIIRDGTKCDQTWSSACSKRAEMCLVACSVTCQCPKLEHVKHTGECVTTHGQTAA